MTATPTMNAANRANAKLCWAIAAASGVAVAAVVVTTFRVPERGNPAPERAVHGVVLRRVDAGAEALSGEAALRDLTPLFLPTERNADLTRVRPREVRPSFLEIKTVRPALADAGLLDLDLPPAVTLNGREIKNSAPTDKQLALNYLEESAIELLAAGFGRNPVQVGEMAPRGGFVEIVSARDGRRLIGERLDSKVRPPTDKVWQPVEFLATVGAAGLVAPLLPTVRSGVTEVDDFFRNYLARTYRVGERLPPGFYRIIVAP
ncbi:MAG: hypothetical protein V4773_09615 [Verrucomicrobiota bacterium]